jgi:hypothetical protein
MLFGGFGNRGDIRRVLYGVGNRYALIEVSYIGVLAKVPKDSSANHERADYNVNPGASTRFSSFRIFGSKKAHESNCF